MGCGSHGMGVAPGMVTVFTSSCRVFCTSGAGIEDRVAVDHELVGVDLRRKRSGGDSPEAGLVLLHGHAGSLKHGGDYLGAGRAETKGRGTVGWTSGET